MPSPRHAPLLCVFGDDLMVSSRSRICFARILYTCETVLVKLEPFGRSASTEHGNLLRSKSTSRSNLLPEGKVMLTQENFSSAIDDIMRGAIDMHVHFGPDMPPDARKRSTARKHGVNSC